MKQILFFLLLSISAVNAETSFAQDLSNPGDYMTAVSNAQKEMNQKYMAYMSAAAHGRKARKVDKLRQQALQSIDNSRFKTIDLPIYKSDNSLRQSSIDYIKLCYNVFNDDYARIVNMEDIAEQSFDEMQEFILLQEKTSEKIHEASGKMNAASKAFAEKYNVKIIESKDELSDKLEQTGKLTHYKNDVYLIFFKCNWQDGEIIKAMNAGKITEAEQGRSSLLRYTTEGLAGLDTLKNFEGDPSLAITCKQVLQFYKNMAENDLPKQMDYFLKKENFEKIKKAFEVKPEKDRTQKDVDAFNDGVKEINKANNTFNDINKKANTGRNDAINKWNDTEKSFADSHMPYYK
ncbi:MAG: hypothetical protein ABI863_24130 [Ginsengibacter sp.]